MISNLLDIKMDNHYTRVYVLKVNNGFGVYLRVYVSKVNDGLGVYLSMDGYMKHFSVDIITGMRPL